MKFDSRFIQDRLRTGAMAEARDTDNALIGDLYDTLTPNNIEDGVSINFGDQRQAFEETIDALCLSSLVWARSSAIHIHNVVVASGATTSYLGRTIEEVGNTSLVDILDSLQADHWKLTEESIYPKIGVRSDSIYSKIILASSTYNEHGEKRADVGEIGVVAAVNNRYLPEFNTIRRGLAYFMRDVEKAQQVGDRNVVGPLLAEMSVSQLSLVMPQRSYLLKVGPLAYNPINPRATIDDVSTAWSFEVTGARLR